MSKQLLGFFLFWLSGTILTVIWIKDDYPNVSWSGCFLMVQKAWLWVILALGLIGMFFYGLALIFGIAWEVG